MKKLLSLLLVPAFLLAMISVVFVLSETHPFSPGDSLFPIQSKAERLLLGMQPNAFRQAEMSLNLIERRISNLALAEGADRVHASLEAFSLALDDAVLHVTRLPILEQDPLIARLKTILAQSETVLLSLDEKEAGADLAAVKYAVVYLETASSSEQIAAFISSRIEGQPVSFLGDIKHDFFPLAGGHTGLACTDCHLRGFYTSTPVQCKACHQPPLDRMFAMTVPEDSLREISLAGVGIEVVVDHFANDCNYCHTVFSWRPYRYEHKAINQCNECHDDDLPDVSEDLDKPYKAFAALMTPSLYSHYPGECNVCHKTSRNWKTASFDHKGVTECTGCHRVDKPTAHYAGDCKDCHPSEDRWEVVEVKHDNFSDCSSCHPMQAHYPRQCSDCHQTNTWKSVSFNHNSSLDCLTCHTRPARHYPGRCGDCHWDGDWSPTDVKHEMADCETCHNAPAEHYRGLCTDCHNSISWDDILFNHRYYTDCVKCHRAPTFHYPGQCSLCHDPKQWPVTTFDHVDFPECQDCHTRPLGHTYSIVCIACHTTTDWFSMTSVHESSYACYQCHAVPENHYTGLCTSCHTTTITWSDISVDHTYLTDCDSCHHIAYHWPGECSNCHTTENWTDIDFDHTNYTDCKACHVRPASHPSGQCSKCHTTESWDIQVTSTPRPTPISNSPTPSMTPTTTPSPTSIIPATNTPTPTASPTLTPTDTPTPTASPTLTPTDTEQPTDTSTPTPSPTISG